MKNNMSKRLKLIGKPNGDIELDVNNISGLQIINITMNYLDSLLEHNIIDINFLETMVEFLKIKRGNKDE